MLVGTKCLCAQTEQLVAQGGGLFKLEVAGMGLHGFFRARELRKLTLNLILCFYFNPLVQAGSMLCRGMGAVGLADADGYCVTGR